MAFVTMPTQGLRDIEWNLNDPSQSTRSILTGATKLLALGPPRLSAKVEVAPRRLAEFLPWRAFAAAVQGRRGVFRVPAVKPGEQAAAPIQIAMLGSGQHSNEVLQSGALDNGLWSRVGLGAVTASSGARATPDGAFSGGFVLEENTTILRHGIEQLTYPTVGQPYCVSIWARAINRSFLAIILGSGEAITYNLVAGTCVVPGGLQGGMIQDDFGWWRCWLSFVPTTGVTLGFYASDGAAAAATYGGFALNSAIALWRPQLDLGLRPAASAITAGAAVVSPSVINLSGLAANATILPAGSMVTSNYSRLHVLVTDLLSGSTGVGAAWLAPPLPSAATASDVLAARNPFGRMRMISDDTSWIDLLMQYQPFSFSCEEAF